MSRIKRFITINLILLFVAMSFNVDAQFKIYCHKKGNHHSGLHLKSLFFKKQDTFDWVIKTTSTMEYRHEGEDQYDWNKLCGVSFSRFAMNHSCMVGWRYNPMVDSIEYAAYIHDGKGVENRRMIRLDKRSGKDDLFDVKLHFLSGNRILYVIDEKTFVYDLKKKVKRKKRLIFPWFGGNLPAPHDVQIIIDVK